MLLDVDTTADRFSLLMAGIVDMKKNPGHCRSLQRSEDLSKKLSNFRCKNTVWTWVTVLRQFWESSENDVVAATTGLPSISETIRRRRSALFGHVARLPQDVRHTRPSTATSTCLSADHPTTSGNAARADPESDGSTRSGRTMGFHRRTCGGVRLLVVTEEQRYGPRWLRDNDDNDEWEAWVPVSCIFGASSFRTLVCVITDVSSVVY